MVQQAIRKSTRKAGVSNSNLYKSLKKKKKATVNQKDGNLGSRSQSPDSPCTIQTSKKKKNKKGKEQEKNYKPISRRTQSDVMLARPIAR